MIRLLKWGEDVPFENASIYSYLLEENSTFQNWASYDYAYYSNVTHMITETMKSSWAIFVMIAIYQEYLYVLTIWLHT